MVYSHISSQKIELQYAYIYLVKITIFVTGPLRYNSVKVYKIYNLDFKLSHTNKIKQNLKPSHMTHLKLISREETVSKTVRSTPKYIVQLL